MLTNLIQRVYADVPDPNDLGTALNVDIGGPTDISELITRILSWIIYIAGVLAFIYLVISGITFITAGGNAEQAKKGQQGIINAVIGIVVVVLAYTILQVASNLARTNGA